MSYGSYLWSRSDTSGPPLSIPCILLYGNHSWFCQLSLYGWYGHCAMRDRDSSPWPGWYLTKIFLTLLCSIPLYRPLVPVLEWPVLLGARCILWLTLTGVDVSSASSGHWAIIDSTCITASCNVAMGGEEFRAQVLSSVPILAAVILPAPVSFRLR